MKRISECYWTKVSYKHDGRSLWIKHSVPHQWELFQPHCCTTDTICQCIFNQIIFIEPKMPDDITNINQMEKFSCNSPWWEKSCFSKIASNGTIIEVYRTIIFSISLIFTVRVEINSKLIFSDCFDIASIRWTCKLLIVSQIKIH